MKNLIFLFREIVYNGFLLLDEYQDKLYEAISKLIVHSLYGIKLLIKESVTEKDLLEVTNQISNKLNEITLIINDNFYTTSIRRTIEIIYSLIKGKITTSPNKEVEVKLDILINNPSKLLSISKINKNCFLDYNLNEVDEDEIIIITKDKLNSTNNIYFQTPVIEVLLSSLTEYKK